MTISGLAMKAWVSALPVVAAGEVAVEGGDDGVRRARAPMSGRVHWPMQGPQALVSTVPPRSWKVCSSPSRSMVA